MAKHLYGERIGQTGRLAPTCNGIIFDSTKTKVLLTRRTDNGRWCVPGGMMEAGESVTEACEREVWEETGLRVRVNRLIGVYSTPHRITEYTDGNRFHFVTLAFECAVVEGELALSNETTEAGYYSLAEIETMDVMEPHIERVLDAFAGQAIAFIK
jgi:ADP-ribose pyrophosphatase YjhB (NUDIX family)